MNELPDPEKYLEILKNAPKPKLVKANSSCTSYFHSKVLPYAHDHVLSELRRHNGTPPRLLGFMDDGSVGIVNIQDAIQSIMTEFDARAKDGVALIHKLGALIPGVLASVFMSEAWTLPETYKGQREGIRNLADHPDREECVVINMLYYHRSDHTMMQLMGLLPIIKVLGVDTSPKAWRETVFGKLRLIDPGDREGGREASGRFVFDDGGDDE